MSLREQWIRPLDALPQDYQHVIAITSSGQEEEMYLVDDKWHIVDGVRIPIEYVVFWHEKREQPTVEMAEDCISREQAVYVASGYCAPQNIADELRKLPSVTPQPKRGKWIDQGDSIGEYLSGCYECDKCHEVFWPESGTPQDNGYNFCPNCGAKMDADMREVQDER